ncbi:MAG: hypothetical protein JST68_18820 [Bacteroidetes bacterium]|nr:hypothetical protein [Bacteroidota bacterium]
MTLLSCNHPLKDTKNALPLKFDTPRSFIKNYGVHDNNKLFAFVGQKIWVQPLPSKRNSSDNGFKARYAVLEKVFGDFPEDTIEFVAYDHYGIPPFSESKNVLLYVSADSGTYFQQKYMYNNVYRTKDGRWAGTYDWDDYKHEYNKGTKIKPVKIEIVEPISFPLRKVNSHGDTLTLSMPHRYFRIIGDTAFAVYGNYVNDLFILKRDGYLTARGIFANGKLVK